MDEMHGALQPQLLRDQYWEEVIPESLPHTVASEQIKDGPPVQSTANIYVTREEGEIIAPASLRSIDMTNLNLSDPPGTPRLLKRPSLRSGRRYSSVRSNSSINSNITRKGSLSGSKFSLFKRLISRENSSKVPLTDNHLHPEGGDVFGSNINVSATIPELDENLVTVVSTRRDDDLRKPTVQEIFGKAQGLGSTPTMFCFDEEMGPTSSTRDEGDEVHLLTELSSETASTNPVDNATK